MGFTRNDIDKKLTHNYLKTSNKQGEFIQFVDISHSKIINLLLMQLRYQKKYQLTPEQSSIIKQPYHCREELKSQKEKLRNLKNYVHSELETLKKAFKVK